MASPDVSAPAVPPEAATAALRRIPGLDVDAGLGRMLGHTEKYLDLLGRFAARQAGAAHAIRTALDAADAAHAQLAAHTLKGVAANLGASALAACCAALEAAQRSGCERAALEPALAALEAEHGQLIAGLAAALHEPAPAPGPATVPLDPCERRAAHEAGRQLLRLLQEDDAAAGSWLAAQSALLAPWLGARYRTVRAAVEEFDYATAEAELAAWLESPAMPP